MDINFELYKIFYHAALYGSFSEAAAKLFISQSAVSQAIKNLEEKLGSSLFYRKARSVKLTPEGSLLFRHIEQAYNFIKQAEGKLIEIQNLDLGEVRIGVGDTICRYFLIQCLKKYNIKYPGIKIQMINRTSSQIISLLKDGLIDLGIVTLPISDPGIAVTEFIDVEDIFVASYKYSDLENKKLSLEELLKYPLLMLDRNSSTRHNIDSFLLKKGLVVKPEIELESVELLVEFAKIGIGISHVLKESVVNSIDKHELFEVKISETLPLRKLGIASVKSVPLSRASDEFIRLLII